MGITRSGLHKHRATGGRMPVHRKKRKFELGRPAANTKLSTSHGGHTADKRVRTVRVRGGNLKFRALRLDHGNFSWSSESRTKSTRILEVCYNASNNELVRTKTLVKGAIVQIDAGPFKTWYQAHYGVDLGKQVAKKDGAAPVVAADVKKSKSVLKKAVAVKARGETRVIDKSVEEQFKSGRLYARISSRPGQSGRCDGYILEGRELEFYVKKMQKKKGKQ